MGANANARVGVVGAAGRMGQALVALIHESSQLALGAAIERDGHELVGADAGEIAGVGAAGVALSSDLGQALEHMDVLIDFTVADATAANIETCLGGGVPMVIGTTGLSDKQTAQLREAGKTLPIVLASNFSVGVNAAFALAEQAARMLGDAVDVEIVEMHHRHKVDAPSGTAITLAEQVAKAQGKDLSKVAVYGREGMTGARDQATIGIHAIRGGDVVGDHTVIFAGAGERLEITHRAQDRSNFAQGALRAAGWIVGQPPGIYSMRDVLAI